MTNEIHYLVMNAKSGEYLKDVEPSIWVKHCNDAWLYSSFAVATNDAQESGGVVKVVLPLRLMGRHVVYYDRVQT